MKIINIKKGWKLAFIGDIHEHEKHFDKLLEKINPSIETKIIIVSLGDLFDKGEGIEAAKSLTNKIRDLYDKDLAYIIRGNHEQKHIKQARAKNNMYQELRWLSMQPVSLQFRFENGTYVTAVHGGVTPNFKNNDLDKIDVMYVRRVNSNGDHVPLIYKTQPDGTEKLEFKEDNATSWGEIYDGRFGYIVAGHDAQLDGNPVYWPYACNIDTGCYKTGVLSCQIFSEKGKEELIQVKSDEL